MHETAETWNRVQNEPVSLVLLEDSRNRGYGETALVEAHSDRLGRAIVNARLSCDTPLYCGERFTAYATFEEIDYEQNSSAWQKGAAGTIKASGMEPLDAPFPISHIVSLRMSVISAIGSQDVQHSLLQALVCGYRRSVEESQTYAQFQECGLAHLVSVSGAHLVIVTGLVATCAEAARIPRRFTIALLITTMVVYFMLAGMPVSALRACIMCSLCLVAYFGKRRPSSLNALGIGIFAIIAHAPYSSIAPSLALSALSTIGIVIFAPLVSYWFARTPLAALPVINDALSLTLSASLLSQLYASSLFSQLPIISPLANVTCAPLFPLICGSGLVTGLLQAASMGALDGISLVSAGLSGILVSMVDWFASVPFASIPFAIDTSAALLLSGLSALALWIWWPHPKTSIALGAILIVVLLVTGPVILSDERDRIVMFDIGQGDSILITSQGRSLLIDTGNQDTKLLQQLGSQHIVHIDSVLITHADDDHCGSLDALQKAVQVDRVLVAHDMLSCDDGAAKDLREESKRTAPDLIGLSYGDCFEVGSFTVEVVWPLFFTDNGGNADSLCVMVSYDADSDGDDDVRALMTGDAEKDELQSMIDLESIGDIDILKVAHHGSRNGMTQDEALALNPEIALISCGAHNRYGHPAPETLDILESVGSSVFRTDIRGTITCVLSSSDISVQCEKQAPF